MYMISVFLVIFLRSIGILISILYCDIEENVFDEFNVCCCYVLFSDLGIVVF